MSLTIENKETRLMKTLNLRSYLDEPTEGEGQEENQPTPATIY